MWRGGQHTYGHFTVHAVPRQGDAHTTYQNTSGPLPSNPFQCGRHVVEWGPVHRCAHDSAGHAATTHCVNTGTCRYSHTVTTASRVSTHNNPSAPPPAGGIMLSGGQHTDAHAGHAAILQTCTRTGLHRTPKAMLYLHTHKVTHYCAPPPSMQVA